jgi:hypothetical protein
MASHSICTVSLSLAVLFLLQACNIDRSTASRREKQASADHPQRPVFGEEPKKSTNRTNTKTAKQNSPLGSEARRPSDADTRSRPLEKSPSRIDQPSASAQTATRTRAGELVAGKAAVPKDSAQASKKTDGRVLHYQPPGARVGDAGELAARQTTIVREPQAAHPIVQLVHRWAETLLSKDLNAHLALYTPVLAHYRGRTNVSHEIVRADRQRLLATLTNIRKFEIYDLTIRQEPGTGRVAAVFRTEWQTGGPKDSSLAAWYRLTCSREGSSWRIESEEQLERGS